MIVIDTNVVSEATHPNGNSSVEAWFTAQSAQDLHLTAPSLAELLVGIAIMPHGKRQARLAEVVRAFLEQRFDNRTLPFDQRAAERYALLIAKARSAGQTVSIIDGQIAAIASVRNFTVATRDVRPFIACGLPVINPWEHGPSTP